MQADLTQGGMMQILWIALGLYLANVFWRTFIECDEDDYFIPLD